MTIWTRVAANDQLLYRLLKVRTNIPASLRAFDITSEMKVTMQRAILFWIAGDRRRTEYSNNEKSTDTTLKLTWLNELVTPNYFPGCNLDWTGFCRPTSSFEFKMSSGTSVEVGFVSSVNFLEFVAMPKANYDYDYDYDNVCRIEWLTCLFEFDTCLA